MKKYVLLAAMTVMLAAPTAGFAQDQGSAAAPSTTTTTTTTSGTATSGAATGAATGTTGQTAPASGSGQ